MSPEISLLINMVFIMCDPKPNLPHRLAPCGQCPYRKDSHINSLGEERMTELLSAQSFVCHKDMSLQCAGHMIIKGDANQYVRLANRLGIDLGLTGQHLVFASESECISQHAIR